MPKSCTVPSPLLLYVNKRQNFLADLNLKSGNNGHFGSLGIGIIELALERKIDK